MYCEILNVITTSLGSPIFLSGAMRIYQVSVTFNFFAFLLSLQTFFEDQAMIIFNFSYTLNMNFKSNYFSIKTKQQTVIGQGNLCLKFNKCVESECFFIFFKRQFF